MNAPNRLNTGTQPDLRSDSELDRLLQKNFTPQDLMRDDNLDKLERVADMLAGGRMTVPEYLRGNRGDAMAIAMQALLWNMDPFAVAQKTHIVSGRLGYEAQLVIAVVQNSGAIRGSFRFEFRGEGNGIECRAGAVLRGETEVTWGEWLALSSVTTKNSPLWKVNPRQQLGYLQAKNWSRLYCPGAILGVYSVDELEDFAPPSGERPASSAPASAPVRPELPPYSDADFEKNLPAWGQVVASGKKTAPDLLAMLSTKATFSEEQKARVLSLKKKPPTDDAPPVDDPFVSDMVAAEAAEGAAK